MRSNPRLPALLLAAALAGCATPRLYQREALVLDDISLEQFQVSYTSDSDCLVQQRWPGRYDADRGPYRITLIPVLRFADEPAEFRLEVRGDGEPTAVARNAMLLEDPNAPDDVHRYRLLPAQRAGALGLTIRRGDRDIGAEEISFHPQQCRALLWRH